MKKLIAIFLFAALAARGSTVWYALTNWDRTLATNTLKITPVSDVPLLNGNYFVTGVSKWLYPTNGFATNSPLAGNYRLEIEGTRYTNIVFAVPDDDDTYCVTNLLISGYGIYNYTPGVRKITSHDGSVALTPPNGMGVVDLSVVGGGGGPANSLTNHQSTSVVLNGGLSVPGSGSESEAIGASTVATNDGAVAFGVAAVGGGQGGAAFGALAQALGDFSSAFGGAIAEGQSSIAIGAGADAGAKDGIAVGELATVGSNGTNGIAIGNQAQAGYQNSVAIGAFATATTNNQMRLGTASTTVSVPGVIAGNGGGLTNLQPASLAAGTAPINISGNAATASLASNVVSGATYTWPDPLYSDTWALQPGLGFFDLTQSTNLPVLGFLGGPVPSVTVNGQLAADNLPNSGAPAMVVANASDFSTDILQVFDHGVKIAWLDYGGVWHLNGSGITNLQPSALVAGTAGINISGNAATASSVAAANVGAGTAAIDISGNAASATVATTLSSVSGVPVGSGTNGQVLTIVSGNPAWANSTGGGGGGDVTAAGQNNFSGSNYFGGDVTFGNGATALGGDTLTASNMLATGWQEVDGNLTNKGSVYLAGIIYGNGAGLTNLQGSSISGTVQSATTAATATSAGSVSGGATNQVYGFGASAGWTGNVGLTNLTVISNVTARTFASTATTGVMQYGMTDGSGGSPTTDTGIDCNLGNGCFEWRNHYGVGLSLSIGGTPNATISLGQSSMYAFNSGNGANAQFPDTYLKRLAAGSFQVFSNVMAYGSGTFTNGVNAIAGPVTAPAFDTFTNSWAANTAWPLGTNLVFTSGAATLGMTGVGNVPTSTERFGQMTITATGTVVFTNLPSIHASDFSTSRTITNGNVAVLSLDVVPGICTNLAIWQFK